MIDGYNKVIWRGEDLEHMIRVARSLMEGPGRCTFHLADNLRDSCIKRNDKIAGVPIQVSVTGDGDLQVSFLENVDAAGVSTGEVIVGWPTPSFNNYSEILALTRHTLLDRLSEQEGD